MNERKLSKAELKKREDIIMNMKDNKRDLVKKYGKDAEAVMYGRATNMAKKQTKEMRDPKLTELIKDALKNPKKADLNKDGKLSDYEEKRGAAIEKNIKEVELPSSLLLKMASEITDVKDLAKLLKGIYDAVQGKEQKDFSKNQKFGRVISFLNDIIDNPAESVKEDLDLGHEDNEPGMIKGDLYQIGKASMALYKVLDQFDDMGEVDLPSWWQSKIFKAKEALVGAKEYLDFELNEPKIDAVVDATIDVVDETVEDYITSVDDLTEENITEDMNYDKWRRAFNGKAFASKIVLSEDGMGNKKRYIIYFRYSESPRADIVSLKERHIGGHEGSGMPFAMSNMQNKPKELFTSDDKMEFGSDEEFERFLQEGSKGLENMLSFYLGGKNVDDAIKDWFDTGVQRIVKIEPAKYFSNSKVNESTSKHNSIAEKLAKELKEGLPKGFWDKKIDAKDEDQDGKVDEDLLKKGGKLSNALDALEAAAKEAKISGDKTRELFAKFKQEMAVSEDRATDDVRDEVDESYDSLVNKIKKQGKSAKAAKAIAGAVASYKAKGGGKGPTAKQK